MISLVMIIRQREKFSLSRKDFRPNRNVMGQILKIGIPIALQDSFIQVAFMIITIIANQRGLNDAAAVGIVEKIISFLFLIPSSMLSTVSALGAQNIGAGKRQRANETLRYAVMITVGFGIIVGIFMQFSPVGGGVIYRCIGCIGSGSGTSGRSILKGICLGLHVRRNSFQLQRIFLCLRQIRHLIFT